MDALLIGPTVALSFVVAMFAGKAVLHVILVLPERRRAARLTE